MIDIEKFICSLLADHPEGIAVRSDIHKALKDQGLEYKDGKIAKIEQSHVWSEEDEEIYKKIETAIDSYYAPFSRDVEEMSKWFKSIKERVQPQNFTVTDKELAQAKKEAYNNVLDKIEYDSENPTFDDGWSAAIWYLKKKNIQPKQEWKQENTSDLTDFENAMMHIGCSFFGDNASLDSNNTNVIKEQANLLLELVPSKEWRKEDILHFRRCLGYIEACAMPRKDDVNWFKSFEDRYTWKPSDEQMHYLYWIANIKLGDSVVEQEVSKHLNELYQDLKKLREE